MPKQKFTDQQFLKQYNKGLYDTEIAYIFNVNHKTVEKRRWKLNLLPNYTITINTVTKPKQHLHKENLYTYQTYRKRYNEAHQTHQKQQHNQNYQKHKERIKQRQKHYRQTHKQQICEKHKRHKELYHKQHPNAKYRQKHKIKITA
jgi:exonuclease VII large subunit